MSLAYNDLWIHAGGKSQRVAGRVPDPETGCRIIVVPEGTQWGSPESLTETLMSMMRHGSLRSSTGAGNRLPTVNLMIEGPSLGMIGKFEERLQRDFAGGAALLEWQPDDPLSMPCVFEVVWSDLKPQFDHLEGLRRLRAFTWEFDALPFAREATPRTVSLDTGTPEVMFGGSTAAGWSSFDSGITFGTSPTSVTMGPLVKGSQVIKTLPASASVTKGDYILVTGGGMLWEWVAPVSGGAFLETMPFLGILYSSSGGGVAAYGPAKKTLTNISSMWLQALIPSGSASIASVATSQGLVAGRQAVLRFDAGGSAPTYGDIHVSDSDLGLVMLHVGPDREGFTPPLSPWVGRPETMAAPVPDATSPSGRAWPLQELGGAAARFAAEVPATHFQRSGSAVLWALLRIDDNSAPVTIQWSTSSWREGVGMLPGAVSGSIRHRFTAANVYEWVPIREIPVPATAFAGRADNSYIEVAIAQDPAAGVTIHMGEGALCPAGPEYSTLVVNAGTHSDLWIEAPSIDNPAGATWVGDDGDRDNAFHAGPLIIDGADAVAGFPSGWTRIFLTTGTTNVAVDVEWFRRFDNHVADLDSDD